jgi:K+-transporting ATPase KdpF subunit
VGDRESLRSRVTADTGGAGTEMFDYVLSGILVLALLVYLGWAMFRPERF